MISFAEGALAGMTPTLFVRLRGIRTLVAYGCAVAVADAAKRITHSE